MKYTYQKEKKKEVSCQFLPYPHRLKKQTLEKWLEMFTSTVISSETTKPVKYINSYSAIYLGWNYLPQNCLFSHKYNASKVGYLILTHTEI